MGGTLFCQIYQSVASGRRYVLIIKVISMTPGGGTVIESNSEDVLQGKIFVRGVLAR